MFGCVLCTAPLEGQDLASWCKDHECQKLSFVRHLALTAQTPVIFNFLFSTELMTRHGDDVEIRAPLYEDTHFSQKSRL